MLNKHTNASDTGTRSSEVLVPRDGSTPERIIVEKVVRRIGTVLFLARTEERLELVVVQDDNARDTVARIRRLRSRNSRW
jgi:hypothetical protein